MFRRLNEQCAPQFYARSDFYFIQVSALAKRVLNAQSRRPRVFGRRNESRLELAASDGILGFQLLARVVKWQTRQT